MGNQIVSQLRLGGGYLEVFKMATIWANTGWTPLLKLMLYDKAIIMPYVVLLMSRFFSLTAQIITHRTMSSNQITILSWPVLGADLHSNLIVYRLLSVHSLMIINEVLYQERVHIVGPLFTALDRFHWATRTTTCKLVFYLIHNTGRKWTIVRRSQPWDVKRYDKCWVNEYSSDAGLLNDKDCMMHSLHWASHNSSVIDVLVHGVLVHRNNTAWCGTPQLWTQLATTIRKDLIGLAICFNTSSCAN
jgi:hypothetical protein